MKATPIRPMFVSEKSYMLHFLVIAVLWLVAMTMDYHDQMREAQAQAEAASKQLVECLNGKAYWKAEDGTEVGCFKAVEN